jgi:hypothetical protein
MKHIEFLNNLSIFKELTFRYYICQMRTVDKVLFCTNNVENKCLNEIHYFQKFIIAKSPFML